MSLGVIVNEESFGDFCKSTGNSLLCDSVKDLTIVQIWTSHYLLLVQLWSSGPIRVKQLLMAYFFKIAFTVPRTTLSFPTLLLWAPSLLALTLAVTSPLL